MFGEGLTLGPDAGKMVLVHGAEAASAALLGEEDGQMSLLDMVLDESPFLNEGEKHLAKRTERVRWEVVSKLGELKALHARHASDAAKRPTVQELIKLIREAMAMIDSKELGLAREEAQRWWEEMTESCRPASKAALTVPAGRKAPSSKAAAAAAAAELAAVAGSSALGGGLLGGAPGDGAADGSDRQTRYIDWGNEPLETVPFDQIDFDEARFKELCISDKAGARTMGTAAMKKVLAMTSDRIFSWAQETKLNMCEGKWPKGDSLRSWVLRPALPEGRESMLTVKIAYSNNTKAFLVHSTRLPRRNSSRRSTLDLVPGGLMAGIAGMPPSSAAPGSPSPYAVMAAEAAPLPSVALRRPSGGTDEPGSPAKRARESPQFVPSLLMDGSAASEAHRAKRATPSKVLV